MKGDEIFRLLAERYKDKPGDYTLSIGHHELPYKDQPVGIFNLPEFYGCIALRMDEVRAWAMGLDSEAINARAEGN